MHSSEYTPIVVVCIIIFLILILIKSIWNRQILARFKEIFDNDKLEVISAENVLSVFTSKGGNPYKVEIYNNGVYQRSEIRTHKSYLFSYNTYIISLKSKQSLEIDDSNCVYSIIRGSTEINQFKAQGEHKLVISEDPIYKIDLKTVEINLIDPNLNSKYRMKLTIKKGVLPRNFLVTRNSLGFFSILPLLITNVLRSNYSENTSFAPLLAFIILVGLCFLLHLINGNGVVLMLMAFLVAIVSLPPLLAGAMLPYFGMYYLKFGFKLIRMNATSRVKN